MPFSKVKGDINGKDADVLGCRFNFKYQNTARGKSAFQAIHDYSIILVMFRYRGEIKQVVNDFIAQLIADLQRFTR